MDRRRIRVSPSRPGELGHRLLVVPLALIAVVTVVDVLAPPDVHLGPFLVAAPAVTASFAGPRTTGAVGVVAVLAQMGVAAARTSLTDLNHTFQITALILISVFVTFLAHLREAHEKEAVQLRSVAEAAQQVVLRPLPERLGPLRIASLYLAAEAEAQIGGDLYAAARTPHGTRLIIGDVRGKGLDAVGDAALVLGAFRAAAHQEGALAGLAAYLETAVTPALEYPDGSRPGPGDAGESFVTATVLDIPDHESVLHLVTCGHPPPLLVRGGRVASLDVAHPAPPLGLGSLADARPVAEVFAFAPGDIVLLYTDGVLEARDDAGVFYPLAERVGRWDGAGPHHLLARLHDDLITHAAGGTLGDDAAMVAIQRLPSAPVTSGPPLTGR